MLERYNQFLIELRENKITIRDFLYCESKDEENLSFDLNATKRFQLLKAMQYNWIKEDEPLVVELFNAEIERHNKEPYQGIFPALTLCAYLLSKFKKPEYIGLFLRAKKANFDTHCGFDYEFLVSAGISDTFEYLEKEKPDYLEDVYNYIGKNIENCSISDDEFQQWKKNLDKYYPNKLQLNNIEDEIELAMDLNETEILKQKIDEWEQSVQSWTKEKLQTLSYYKRWIDDIKGQIWATEHLLEFHTTDWDKASALQHLSELLLKINDFEQTWIRLQQMRKHLRQIPDWKIYGLGRVAVEIHIDLVLSIGNSDNPIAKEAFKWASDAVRKMKNLHLNFIEKVSTSASLMGDIQLSNKFKKKYSLEKKKHDDLFK
ncbi:hypothetical protein [Elizabethkingia anophelis]|uniref:hypothetical protein n=1 Tax=Elizabethkingia anophelis TaxID=1117645 RepID=UPI00301D80C5